MDSEKTLLRLLTEILALWMVWGAVIYADWVIVRTLAIHGHTLLPALCMMAGCYLANVITEWLGNKFDMEESK